MLENIAATAAMPLNSGSVFTVIWQGVDIFVTEKGEEEVAQNFVTEVVPAHYSYLEIPTFTDVWGAIACGEENDGNNPFDRIDVIAVLEGGVIVVDTEDRTDE